MRVVAIVPAAGIGKRMKKGVKKPFLILGKRPILAHTLSRLEYSHYIHEIILVVDASEVKRSKILIKNFRLNKVSKIVEGGKSRFESVWNGLDSINGSADLIFIHDGVRPFISSSTISKTVKAASDFGGAVAAVPAVSTIKFVERENFITSTPNRDKLWIVGTPQVFKYNLIARAYKDIKRKQTKFFDDSSLIEKAGGRVKVIPDSYQNIKITTPTDLLTAKAILEGR